jgi:fibronectin type 3 domain-containing protein
MKRFALLTAAISFAFFPRLFAMGGGTSYADFLTIGCGARPSAMGGAYTAIADDASGNFWNPAGITAVDRISVTAMHLVWFMDDYYDYFSAAAPLDATTDIALSANAMIVPSFDSTGGLGTPAPASYDIAGTFTYAKNFGSIDTRDFTIGNISLGASIKYMYRQLAGIDYASQMLYDAGFMAGINQDIKIGITASDMGEAVNGENSPFNVRFGLSYNMKLTNDSGILIDCDVEKPVDMADTAYQQWLVSAGAEIKFLSCLFLRGGYKSGNSDEGFAVGGGFKWPSVCDMDYAFVPHDALGATHRISLSFNFGNAVARPAIGAPSPPENVTAAAGDRTASVSWDPAGQGDITGYNVYYREKGGEKYSKLNSAPVTDERKLTMMLSNGIAYQFAVTSVNSRGLESVYSSFAEATPEKHGSKKPLRVDGVNTSEKDGNIMVEWNDTRDEAVAGYNLYYKKSGDAKFRKLNQKLLSENKATLGGLQKKVRYFFMVTSVSADGVESDYSEISSRELPVEGY